MNEWVPNRKKKLFFLADSGKWRAYMKPPSRGREVLCEQLVQGHVSSAQTICPCVCAVQGGAWRATLRASAPNNIRCLYVCVHAALLMGGGVGGEGGTHAWESGW
jgi:hypothetical protein